MIFCVWVLGSSARTAANPERALSRVLDRAAAGAVVLRTVSMGLGEAALAHELIESRKVTGKICLLP